MELFTSEGCSSCPPADALALELERSSLVAGTEVVVLSEHVDYWDRLGWRDAFASPFFSERQRRYARQLGQSGVYTPQMVIDGRRELVGSDRSQALKAISAASSEPKAVVHVLPGVPQTSPAGVSVPLAVHLQASGGSVPNEAAEVYLMIAEGALVSRVARGENAGRTLQHPAVVRRFLGLGPLDRTGKGFSVQQEVHLEPGWNPNHLRAVVIAQERTSGRVLGIGSVALPAIR